MAPKAERHSDDPEEFGSGHSSGDIEEVTTRRSLVERTINVPEKAKDFFAEKTHLPPAVKFFIILLVILAIAGCIFCILRFMKKRRSVNNSPKGMNGVDMKSIKPELEELTDVHE